jgi:hypothetical protein
MDATIGTMTIGGKTFQVCEAKLQVVTRPERSGDWQYLFLFAGGPEEQGCFFNLDCYGLRTGTTLAGFAGGRIHVDEKGVQPDDTLSDGDDDSMAEACVWTLLDEKSGEEVMWFFRRLDVRFRGLGGGRLHVLLSAALADMDENRLEASAEFTVTGTSETAKAL